MALVTRPKHLFFTPTGNELPPVLDHIRKIADMLGAEIITPPGPTLEQLIREFNALPNFRMRWCTRMIKVQPAMAWVHAHPEASLAVGLRADEEARAGIYGLPEGRVRFPLRERGWGLPEVLACCEEAGVEIPERTDCAVCFFQRLGEWWRLWKNWRTHWQWGEAWERQVGHTFRSPSRDTWPASMKGLRERFEKGDKPRGADDSTTRERKCRVCSL